MEEKRSHDLIMSFGFSKIHFVREFLSEATAPTSQASPTFYAKRVVRSRISTISYIKVAMQNSEVCRGGSARSTTLPAGTYLARKILSSLHNSWRVFRNFTADDCDSIDRGSRENIVNSSTGFRHRRAVSTPG